MKKRIISFSLYTSERRASKNYVYGAAENLRLQRELFPEWSCCFYVSEDLEEAARDLENDGAEVLHRRKSLGHSGALWRYEAMLRDDYEALMFRDTDCRLSLREKHLVDLWIESGKNYHLIRDSPGHHKGRMMGGLWGLRRASNCVVELVSTQIRQIAVTVVHHGEDERFLTCSILPEIGEDVMEHDSNVDCTPFLEVEEGFFVGKSVSV